MVHIEEQVSLKLKNTYKIGGNARFYCEPSYKTEIIDAVRFSKQENLALLILSKGSNLLISDSGWDGLVVNLAAKFDSYRWEKDRLICDSGALLNTLIHDCVSKGYEGCEELAGIPGTIGGAVIMNAGAFKDTIADTVESVDFYNCETDTVQTFSNSDMEFGYRKSKLQEKKVIILSVTLKLNKALDPSKVASVREEILARRKAKQPLDYPNCGSVFKRPPGEFAGTLIEQCNLKGLSFGDAEVSQKHANFIVNVGNATANDVRGVIYEVQKRVYEQKGILLEPEVIFIGSFDQPLFTPNQVEL